MPSLYLIIPEESSLSALDQVTQDFGPGLEATKVLYISSIILLLGMAKLHSFIEYLITSTAKDLGIFFEIAQFYNTIGTEK